MTNSFSFCFVLVNMEFLVYSSFFWHFKYIIPCFLASTVSVEKLTVNFTEYPLHMISYFSFADFKIYFLFGFDILTIMCLGVALFEFMLAVLSATFSLLPLRPLLTVYSLILRYARGLVASLHFFIFFSFCSLDCIITIDLSSSFMIIFYA